MIERSQHTLNDQASFWWRPWRIVVGVALAACVAGIAFVYRFNTLGGTLGGFDNDHFATLARTEMLLHAEQPLRDFADAELRGAWPALSYAVPAWAQQLGGRTLLPEAYLTVGALALAYALVFLVALDLSKRWSVAMLGVAVALAVEPKLYNYSKVLAFALGGVALVFVARKPHFASLLIAAAVTAMATLFRHDYGVYLAGGIIGAIVGASNGASITGRRVGVFLGLTAALLLPSAIWVQRYEGIPTYLANGLTTSRSEGQRTSFELPRFDISSPFSDDGLVVLTYFSFWALVVIGAAAVRWSMLDAGGSRQRAATYGTAIGLLAMTIVANVFLLRANLIQRFGDAAVPAVLLASWTSGAARSMAAGRRRDLASIAPAGLLMVMLGAAYGYADISRKLNTSGLTVSWEETTRRFTQNRSELAGLPPDTWEGFKAEGPLVAARYVAECTAPTDYLFVTGYAPELPVLARRRFAAGLGTMSLSLYTSEADQRLALGRLEYQSVPIVLADAAPFDDEFVPDYPLLAQYLSTHYRPAGTIDVDDDRRFRVLVDAGRTPRRRDPHLGLPCFQ
jgi:hypothetical protein